MVGLQGPCLLMRAICVGASKSHQVDGSMIISIISLNTFWYYSDPGDVAWCATNEPVLAYNANVN